MSPEEEALTLAVKIGDPVKSDFVVLGTLIEVDWNAATFLFSVDPEKAVACAGRYELRYLGRRKETT